MSLLSSLRDLFRRPCPSVPTQFSPGTLHLVEGLRASAGTHSAPPQATKHQLNVQALAIRRLILTGWIDAMEAQKLGTTDARKIFTRLRRMGLLYEANDPKGYVEVPNRSGHGRYRRHRWTRKFPPGWTSPFSGERRARKRGKRS